jgi:hypothetical protein
MPKRGPTDTDRQQLVDQANERAKRLIEEGDVEVVNAAGERKTASLPKRMLAGARDLVSMTDEQRDLADPGWQPGELDPVFCPEGGTTLQCSLPKGHSGPHDYQPRHELADDDRTLVTGNTGIERAEQPPANVLTAYRQQHRANNARIAEQGMRNDAQLVNMDEQARRRVIDISHLFALGALRNEAAALLAADGWALVPKRLVSQFRAELDEWERDIEAGGS